MKYEKLKPGDVFTFEGNEEYPKKKTTYGHIDIRDGVANYHGEGFAKFEVSRIDVCCKIWDPVEGKFCSSGTGLYGRKRSIWNGMAQAKTALNHMENKDRLEIKTYILVEVQ
jgi:hypothetical protein